MSRSLTHLVSTIRRSRHCRAAAVVATAAASVVALSPVAGSASPGHLSPGSAAPGPHSPGSTAPGPQSPGSAVPGSAVPGSAVSGAAAPGSGHGRDLAALRHLRQRQESAWERGDARAYAAVYTTDADVVTFNGDHLSGRAGIEEGMGYYFTTYLRGTRLLQRDERIRFPEPDIAVIVRTGCVLWPGETACTEEALSVNTNVAVKRQGRWLYTSFQNTRVRPLPR